MKWIWIEHIVEKSLHGVNSATNSDVIVFVTCVKICKRECKTFERMLEDSNLSDLSIPQTLKCSSQKLILNCPKQITDLLYRLNLRSTTFEACSSVTDFQGRETLQDL